MTAWREQRAELDRKVARLQHVRKHRGSPWRTAMHAGALGWMLVLPTVLGGLAGHWLGRAEGLRWPAVLGLLIGLSAGVFGVWRSVTRSLEEEKQEEEP